MQYISGTGRELGSKLQDLGIYRHQVFVQRLGWALPDATGYCEWDGFDRPDTVHVLALDERERLSGCARLLPTTRPYLLAEVFPQLLDGAPAPECHETWELSRFSAINVHGATPAENTLGTCHSLALLAATMRIAASKGARRLISVSPVGIQRILRHGGYAFSSLGKIHRIDGQLLFACTMPL